jgi:hypothetical protein
MKLKQIEYFKIFKFEPYQAQKEAIIPLAYKDFIFAFKHGSQEALDLEKSLEETLFFAFPKMSFMDLAKLFSELSKEGLSLDPEALLNLYNLKWTQDIERLFQILPTLPEVFQKWAAEKDLSFGDLRILSWAQEQNVFTENQVKIFLETLAKLHPSRQIGVKILEYFFELISFELSSPDLLQNISNIATADELHKFLYAKRFPTTTKRDQEFETKVQKFPWPAHVKAQWVRQGDRAGVEIRMMSVDSQDLKKKISALADLKEKFDGELWN